MTTTIEKPVPTFRDVSETLAVHMGNLEKSSVLQQEQVNIARKEVEALERIMKASLFTKNALTKALSSWSVSDPGKSGEVWFFLDVFWKRVIPQEIAPKVYSERRGLSVIPFASVMTGICPSTGCGQDAFAMESYEQTEDGPDGDTWTKKWFLVCPVCRFSYVHPERKEQDERSNRF